MIIVKIEDKQNKDIKLYKEITNTWLLNHNLILRCIKEISSRSEKVTATTDLQKDCNTKTITCQTIFYINYNIITYLIKSSFLIINIFLSL